MSDIVYVPLRTRRGVVRAHAIIDAVDSPWVLESKWFLSGSGYAIRHMKLPTGGFIRPQLHRLILGIEQDDPRQIDHINRVKLDNRRSNLRIVTTAENAQNKGSAPGSSSRFRGVTWDAARRKWSAQAKMAGVNHNLGRFDTEEEAAMVVSEWRRMHMPGAIEEAA